MARLNLVRATRKGGAHDVKVDLLRFSRRSKQKGMPRRDQIELLRARERIIVYQIAAAHGVQVDGATMPFRVVQPIRHRPIA
jgi:hypothetical protein